MNISFFTKIIIAAGIVLLAGSIGFIVYQVNKISARQDAIEKNLIAQKDLADSITRSSSQYLSKKDLEAFAEKQGLLLKNIQSDVSKLHASIMDINTVEAKSNGKIITGSGSNSETPKPKQDTSEPVKNQNKYLDNTETINLAEDFPHSISIPIGTVSFSAWREKPWDYNIFPRKYSITTVLASDADEKHIAYNKFTIESNGKNYAVPIDTAQLVEQYPDSVFSFWNPKIALGLSGGINAGTSFTGNVSTGIYFSPFSYGRFKTKPDWIFLQVGPAVDLQNKKIEAVVSPAIYNVGKTLTWLNNTYVGPSLAFSPNTISILGSVSLTF